MTPSILYIHGLNSSPTSTKASQLFKVAEHCGIAQQLRVPALHHHPRQAMVQLTDAGLALHTQLFPQIQAINQELLGDVKADESRLLTEVTVYADKICVDEEIVRLQSHISAMKKSLTDGGSIGRKLDFLAQEMNREANTILSKTTDLELSNCGIELKTLIEKVREQIQNIE